MSTPSGTRHFRVEDKGTWCCLLLPVAVCLHNQSDVLPIVLLAVTSILCGVSWGITDITCTSVSIVTSLISLVSATAGLALPDIACLVPCLLLYCLLVSKLPGWFPGSFTFGEMSLMSQGYVWFLYKVLTRSVAGKRSAPATLDMIAGAVFGGTSLVVLLLYEVRHPSMYRLALYAAGLLLTGFVLTMQSAGLVAELLEIQSTLQEVLWSYPSAFLLAWWILCTLVCILIVGYYGNQTSFNQVTEVRKSVATKLLYMKTNCRETLDMDLQNMQLSKFTEAGKTKNVEKISPQLHDHSSHSCDNGCGQASGSDHASDSDHKMGTRRAPAHVRKYFHLAMLCVYVPGLMVKPALLYLASTGAAAIMVVLEAVRILSIPPLGEMLDGYLKVFLDEQDKGHLILTPIYLLIGCSLPLWIAHRNTDSPCSVLFHAGLISIGVGDSAASVIGRRWGKHKWPHSRKSLEGTAAAIVSQMLALHVLSGAGVPGSNVTIATVTIVILVSCLEAFTSQIDNLVVPIFAFTLFTMYQCYTLNTLDLRERIYP